MNKGLSFFAPKEQYICLPVRQAGRKTRNRKNMNSAGVLYFFQKRQKLIYLIGLFQEIPAALAGFLTAFA
jgi:hypothetical protein